MISHRRARKWSMALYKNATIGLDILWANHVLRDGQKPEKNKIVPQIPPTLVSIENSHVFSGERRYVGSCCYLTLKRTGDKIR